MESGIVWLWAGVVALGMAAILVISLLRRLWLVVVLLLAAGLVVWSLSLSWFGVL